MILLRSGKKRQHVICRWINMHDRHANITFFFNIRISNKPIYNKENTTAVFLFNIHSKVSNIKNSITKKFQVTKKDNFRNILIEYFQKHWLHHRHMTMSLQRYVSASFIAYVSLSTYFILLSANHIIVLFVWEASRIGFSQHYGHVHALSFVLFY